VTPRLPHPVRLPRPGDLARAAATLLRAAPRAVRAAALLLLVATVVQWAVWAADVRPPAGHVLQVVSATGALLATWWIVRWRAAHSLAERRVWSLLSASCAVYGAGALGALVVGLGAVGPDLPEVPAAVCSVATFPLAYRAVVRWSRHSAGVDADDLINGVSSALVLVAVVLCALTWTTAGTGVQPWLPSLPWREVLLAVEAACVLIVVLAALTSALVSRLHRDARIWLVTATYALGGAGTVAALLDGGRRPAWWLPVSLLALLALSSAALLPVRFVPTEASDPIKSTKGAFAIVSAGMLVTVTILLSRAPDVVGLCAALAVMGSSVRLLINHTELAQLAASRREALTDELTGVANRRALVQELDRRLALGGAFQLLVFDLDHFKEVNDSLGHGAGDELLRMVTQRVQPRLAPGALLGRLGGDEFAVVAAGAAAEAGDPLSGLREAFGEPFPLGGMSVHVDVSTGTTTWTPPRTAGGADADPAAEVDAGALLRQADTAMYEAKRTGSLAVAYDPVRHGDPRGLLAMVGQLRQAIGAGQLRVHYQPQLHTAGAPGRGGGGALAGVEALVRWQHPHLGLLLPAQFLPLAESHGLMDVVTREVLEQAVAQQATWRAAGRPLRVSVNLSAGTLLDTSLPRTVHDLLERHGVPAGLLVLEVTETALLREPERSLVVVEALRALGVQVSIDDFGTGYSSLTQLRQLPVSELKLDRAFTVDLLSDPRARAIVASTIALAHALELRVVAEGVEDDATLAALTGLGCDETQGYLHARPLSAPAFDEWLRRREDRVATADPAPVATP
jgi:diguanylate cyclase (GGDEF)-like protein